MHNSPKLVVEEPRTEKAYHIASGRRTKSRESLCSYPSSIPLAQDSMHVEHQVLLVFVFKDDLDIFETEVFQDLNCRN